jgi:hypothetical protein
MKEDAGIVTAYASHLEVTSCTGAGLASPSCLPPAFLEASQTRGQIREGGRGNCDGIRQSLRGY